MAIEHRFLLLIHILYYAAIIHGILLDINDGEICNILCKECNASAIFVNSQCECNFNDNNNEGIKCINSLQRNIQSMDLNAFSNNLTDEKRSVRATLKSRRRLRIGDAEKVAQYFINGGSSAGRSHFIRESDAVCDNTNSATNSLPDMVRQNNIKNEFHLPLTTKPSSGSTYKSQGLPLHMVSKAASTIQGPDIHDIKSYTSTLRMKPTLSYPVNRLYPPSAMMGSIVHQPYKKYGYQSPPHILIRTAAPSSHILHNLAAHRYSPYYSYMHHSLTGKNPYPRQDNLPITSFVGQSYGNNDFNHQASNNSSTIEHNADKPIKSNVANIPDERTNTLYQSMQYKHLVPSYQHTPYQNNFLHVLYSPLDDYIAQAVPHYVQRTMDSMLTSVQNQNSSCNYINTERQSKMLTTAIEETTHFNDGTVEKTDDTTKDHISVSKEQKET